MTGKAKIIGVGSYLPEQVLSNQDLEKMVDTSDEWIVARTGMKERRIAKKNESTSDMGYSAAIKALKAANVKPHELELILFATHTPDYLFPSSACIIQGRLGAKYAAAVDVQAACTGFLYVISMAKVYVEAGVYKNVLVIASDKISSIVDYKDRNTCVLFGDGASSCVIQNATEGFTIENVVLGADGDQCDLIKLPAGGSKLPSSQETIDQRLHYLKMEGKEVFKHAVRSMESAVNICLKNTGLKEEDISWLVPHQANIRIIESLAKRFKIPNDRVFLTIHKYGNTSASSVGIAFDELVQKKNIKKGEHIVLFAFGAGLTWGAATITCEVTT